MQAATAVDFGLIDRFTERKNGPRNLPEGRIGGADVRLSENFFDEIYESDARIYSPNKLPMSN